MRLIVKRMQHSTLTLFLILVSNLAASPVAAEWVCTVHGSGMPGPGQQTHVFQYRGPTRISAAEAACGEVDDDCDPDDPDSTNDCKQSQANQKCIDSVNCERTDDQCNAVKTRCSTSCQRQGKLDAVCYHMCTLAENC